MMERRDMQVTSCGQPFPAFCISKSVRSRRQCVNLDKTRPNLIRSLLCSTVLLHKNLADNHFSIRSGFFKF